MFPHTITMSLLLLAAITTSNSYAMLSKTIGNKNYVLYKNLARSYTALAYAAPVQVLEKEITYPKKSAIDLKKALKKTTIKKAKALKKAQKQVGLEPVPTPQLQETPQVITMQSDPFAYSSRTGSIKAQRALGITKAYPTPHEILGIASDATEEEIIRAFGALLNQWNAKSTDKDETNVFFENKLREAVIIEIKLAFAYLLKDSRDLNKYLQGDSMVSVGETVQQSQEKAEGPRNLVAVQEVQEEAFPSKQYQLPETVQTLRMQEGLYTTEKEIEIFQTSRANWDLYTTEEEIKTIQASKLSGDFYATEGELQKEDTKETDKQSTSAKEVANQNPGSIEDSLKASPDKSASKETVVQTQATQTANPTTDLPKESEKSALKLENKQTTANDTGGLAKYEERTKRLRELEKMIESPDVNIMDRADLIIEHRALIIIHRQEAERLGLKAKFGEKECRCSRYYRIY